MAKIKPKGPLTDEDYARLCEAEKMCTETADYLKRCEECGINVDPETRKNNEQLELARKMRAKFFPDRK